MERRFQVWCADRPHSVPFSICLEMSVCWIFPHDWPSAIFDSYEAYACHMFFS